MLGVQTSKFERPFQLLGLGSSSSTPHIDYARFLSSKSAIKDSGPSTEIVDKYSLLQYIIDNWVVHTKGFRPHTSRQLQDLAMYRSLPFEFRPWGRNQHYGPYGCGSCKPGASSSEAGRSPFMSLVHYAVDAGHLALIGPLVKEYWSYEADNYRRVDFDWDAEADCWLLQRPFLDEHRSSGRPTDQTVLIAIRKDNLTLVQHITPFYDRASLHTFVTMINTAASCGHVMVLRYLLGRLETNPHKRGDYVLHIKEYAHTTLALAAANGLHAEVAELLREGVSLDKRVDKLGETAISAAAANGHDHIVRFLVDHGALPFGWGTTALHRAAENGYVNVPSTLLELPEVAWVWKHDSFNVLNPPHILGALDYEGMTPLHKAARNGHADVVQVMLGRAATTVGWVLATTPASSSKQTALHLAAANGWLAVVRLLREYGSLLDANIKTPLMLAAEENHVPVVKALVEVDDQLPHNSPRNSHTTALDDAIVRGHEEVAQILLEHWTAMVTVDRLVLAAEYGYEVILKALIKAYRKGLRMYVYDDTTQKLLFEACNQAQDKKLDEAARLLIRYWDYCEEERRKSLLSTNI